MCHIGGFPPTSSVYSFALHPSSFSDLENVPYRECSAHFFSEVVLNHGSLPLLGSSPGVGSSPNLVDPSGKNSEFSPLLVCKVSSFTYYQVDALGFHPALLMLSYFPVKQTTPASLLPSFNAPIMSWLLLWSYDAPFCVYAFFT